VLSFIFSFEGFFSAEISISSKEFLLRLRKPRPVGVEHLGCAYELLGY